MAGTAIDRILGGALRRSLILAFALGGTVVLGHGLSTRWPGCDGFTIGLELAVRPENVPGVVGDCQLTRHEVWTSLGWDLLFPFCYATLIAVPLYLFSRQTWRMRETTQVARWLAAGALLAGVLDLAENTALFVGTRDWDRLLTGEFDPLTSGAFAAAAGLAWVKFGLLTLALLGFLALVLGLFGYSGQAPADIRDEFAPAKPDPGRIGIAVSGGGMRSATFSIGVLRGLDDTGVFRQARWLAAVSGGAYAAGAWYTARRGNTAPATARTSQNAASQPASDRAGQPGRHVDNQPVDGVLVDGLLADHGPQSGLYRYLLCKRHYLSSGRGGLILPALKFVVFLATNLALLYVFLWLVTRPFGWLIGSSYVAAPLRDGLTNSEKSGFAAGVVEHGLPPVAAFLLVAAVLLVLAVPLGPIWHRRLLYTAGGFVAAAAVVAAVLILTPLAMSVVPDWWARLGGANPKAADTDPAQQAAADRGAALIQLATSLGLVSAITAVLKGYLLKAAPRLGGVLVGVLALLLGGQIATKAAYLGPGAADGDSRYVDPIAHLGDRLGLTELTTWLALLLLIGVGGIVVNQRWWSLHMIYKRGLRNTFSPTYDAGDRVRLLGPPPVDGVYPLRSRREPPLSEYPEFQPPDPANGTGTGTGPELLLCAAANAKTSLRTGMPAYSFVLSQSQVGWYEPGPDGRAYTVPTDRFVRSLPGLKWFRDSQGTVSAAVATTGAAVASAMGRQSMGTTNALLAVFNLRLGLWLPNPARIGAHQPLRRFATPKLTYLLKEVFGRCDPRDDPYVYVSDGGHWENLGLVELIRRRCRTIYCADASGDKEHSFATLNQAIELAAQECDAVVTIDLTALRPQQDAALPATNVAVGHVRYADGTPGKLVYGKLQVAQDSSTAVRGFRAVDRKFPRYFTFNLFLRERQFEYMVRLGEEVAARMAALEPAPAYPPAPEPQAPSGEPAAATATAQPILQHLVSTIGMAVLAKLPRRCRPAPSQGGDRPSL